MADGVTKNVMKISQFDGTNFCNWKYRVGILLDEKDLKHFINEKLSDILAKEKDDVKQQQIRKDEKKCVSILVQTIHDNQLEYVREKTLAKDMFDTLCSIFERKSVASQVLLRKQLLTMKYNESDTMMDYLLLFDKRIRELKSTGATMEELDVVVHLLITMPKSYDNLVTALETMDQTKLTVEFVKPRLLDEYNKRNGGVGSNKSSGPGAMVAGGKSKDIVCYLCKKPGHKKSQCFKNKNKKKNNESANKASDAKESSMCAFVSGDTMSMVEKPTAFSTHSNQHSGDTTEIKFVLDSGATQHMVNDKRYFDKLEKIDELSISVAKKNQSISAKQRGEIAIKTFHDGDSSTKTMENVLLVNDLKCNLMSIRSLTKKGYRIVFEGDYAYASINDKVNFIGRVNGKLYEVILHVDNNVFAGFTGKEQLNKISRSLWHFRLGHLNANDMKKLIGKMADGLEKVNVDNDSKLCESCVFGKQTRMPFPKNTNTRSSRILELIHSDVCGPFPTTAYDGSRYFVTFTDDFSRASIVYCIERKSEVLDKFKEFVAMAEALHGKRVAKLKSDNGGEYTSNEFKSYCKQKGIQMIFTVAHNPEMNSVSERLNRTLLEKSTTMLLASGLQEKYWNEAINTANYIKNRSPTNAVGKQFETKTPAEIWFGQKPNLSHLRIFGSECYNHIPSEKRSKLQAKSSKCIMLGYCATFGTYRLWDIEHRKLIFGRNVTFNESSVLNRANLMEIIDSEAATDGSECDKEANVPGNDGVNKDADPLSDDLQNNGDNVREIHNTSLDGVGNNTQQIHDVNLDDIGDIEDNVNSADDCIGNNDGTQRKSERVRRKPDFYGVSANECDDAHMALLTAQFNEDEILALSAEQFVEDDPLTMSEAKRREDWPEWKMAVENEYQSLIKNNTWTVCDLPTGRKSISNKWVFKLKKRADGSTEKYKARLVARGFTQKQGFDYNETYSPVAKLVTLKILLAVANHEKMHIHQMDVKSAFLNGELKEDIYMQLPDGFGQNNKVCKLNKALYGLKQASRAWNEKFNAFMIRIGFQRCRSDQCLYVKEQNGIICYILLYVDDSLIFCRDLKMIDTVKKLLSNEFEMTDMGRASSFLGMQIEQNVEKGTIIVSQSQYLKRVLQKFGMQDCKPKSTPMEKGLHLELGDSNNCSNHPYRELIGCLTYAHCTTRPDLCAATGYFSRFQSCFNANHFNHAKRILNYIQATIDLKMIFKRDEKAKVVVGYSDSDWAGDKNDSKSTSGYVFKLFGNTVSWASRKQATVAKSSTEAEYVALSEAVSECEWMKKLLIEMKIDCNQPIPIYEDNTSCIKIAEEPREYKRMKHIDVKYMFVRDHVEKGEYSINQVSTENQTADIMTKGLGKTLFVKHRNELNLF